MSLMRLTSRFLLISCLAFSLSACVESRLHGLKDDLDTSSAPSMLWQAQKNNEQTIYLLGTFHLGISPDDLHPAVWQYLDKAELVIGEVDIFNVSQEEALRYLTLPSHRSLKDILDAKTWRLLVTQLSDRLPPEHIERMSLYAVFQLLLYDLVPNTESIDLAILTYARDHAKELAFFEDYKFQAELLTAYIEPEMISHMIRSSDHVQEYFHAMVDVYLEGDIERLDKIMRDPDQDFAMSEQQFKVMISDRNRAWVKKLGEMERKGPSFLAVGAGHLPGETGLLALLEANGYTLERL